MFPVPKGAHIDKFSMEIGGKNGGRRIVARGKGAQIYEEIVRKMRDPALLEYAGRDLFKVRIFPIEPRSRKPIKISYSEITAFGRRHRDLQLPVEHGEIFRASSPIKKLERKSRSEIGATLASIYSPSHKVEIKNGTALIAP